MFLMFLGRYEESSGLFLGIKIDQLNTNYKNYVIFNFPPFQSVFIV